MTALVVIAVAVVVVGAAAGGAILASRRRRALATPAAPAEQPMLGLEAALDQAMDRDGRNMRERLATGASIEDLRRTDDTGPILRRALDNVEHRVAHPAGETHEPPAASA